MSAPTPPAITVSGQPPQPPAQPPAPEPQAPVVSKELEDLKQQYESVKQQLEEHKRTAQFWYDKANKPEDPKPVAATQEEQVDLLDLITSKGVKGFDEFMRKRGYVSRDEVEQTVNSKAAQIRAEDELYSEFPELKNQQSDFFKAAALEYGDLVKQGVPEAVAMKLAARQVALNEIQAGKRKTPQQKSDEEKAARDAEREARKRAQMPDRDTRTSEADPEDEELTPDQKRIVAAMGISEEAYKKRAKEGVRMSMRAR